MTGFEPVASYMRSKRSTTELHPLLKQNHTMVYKNATYFSWRKENILIFTYQFQNYHLLYLRIIANVDSINIVTTKQFVT